MKTRDPERIDKVLDSIRDVWKKNPDLRLCQLLVIITSEIDNFSVEDDIILSEIEKINNRGHF